MYSVSGWSSPSQILNEPINTPIGNARAAERTNPAVTRVTLILTSVQRLESPRKSRAVAHTLGGEGMKTGLIHERPLSHHQNPSMAAKLKSARAR